MSRTTRTTITYALLAGTALLAAACSGQNPVSSGTPAPRGISSLTSLYDTEFEATIATIDPGSRVLTFSDSPEQVLVDAQAEIERHIDTSGMSVRITFGDLATGDHVRVRGNRQPDGTVLAGRVEVRNADDHGQGEDDELHSVITSIDYADSSFTVAGRLEQIRVTGSTQITGHVSGRTAGASSDGGSDDSKAGDDSRDTVIAFDSLIVGDSVEVNFVILDAGTLEATRIQMENEIEDHEDVEFKDTLATVDVAGGIVTFQTQSWVGVLDPHAVLLDHNQLPVSLSAFVPGQQVEVKGLPQVGDTLLVVRMKMDNN